MNCTGVKLGKPLRREMLASMSVAAGVCLAVALLFQSMVGYLKARSCVESRLEAIAVAQAAQLATRLWELDYGALTSSAKTLLSVHGVAGVVVREASGAFELRLGDMDLGERTKGVAYSCSLRSPPGGLDMDIGELTVIADPGYLNRLVWSNFWMSALTLCGLALALTAAGLLILRNKAAAPAEGLLALLGHKTFNGNEFVMMTEAFTQLRSSVREAERKRDVLDAVLPGGAFHAACGKDGHWRFDLPLGLGASELLDRPSQPAGALFFDVLPEECLDTVRRLLGQQIRERSGTRFCISGPVSGDSGWRMHATIGWEDPEQPTVDGVVLDAKERIKAESRAKSLKRKLGEVLEAPAGLVRVDCLGRIVEANRSFSDMFGYQPEETVRLEIKDLHLSKASFETFLREHLETLDSTGRLDVEYRLKRKDGQPVWMRITAEAAGPGRDAWIVFQDIGEQKRLQNELNVLSMDLKRAREESEQASRAKQEFLANVSHELRSPLGVIIGLADLMMRSDIPVEIRERLGFVRESGHALLGVINDILDYSRIDGQQLQLQCEPFRLEDLLEEVMRLYRSKASDKGLEFTASLALDAPPVVEGDRQRLGQLLANLVSNAVKFTDQGLVALTVEVEERSEDCVTLRFTVRDTGVGAPPEALETMFEPFTQVDGSPSRRHGGTGLGLSICRRLAQCMGGELRVESAQGKGSSFFFSVDLAEGRPEDLAGPGDEGEWPGGRRVLVVDDGDMGRLVIREMLESAGLEVQEAANGREALDLLGREKFDAVLMDVQMSGMDGLEAVRRLRATPGLEDLPVIAMTAHAMIGDREVCMEAGMSDYVAKPVGVTQLLAVMDAWLGSGGRRRQAGGSRP